MKMINSNSFKKLLRNFLFHKFNLLDNYYKIKGKYRNK